MAQELVYTSAKQGLKPGSHGFCTVAMTSGMAPNLVGRLEAMSGYRFAFPPHDPKANLNPVNVVYYPFVLAGRNCFVLSRICSAGFDHTQRSNMFAHHLVLDEQERTASNPAWLALQHSTFISTWNGDARVIEQPKVVAVPSRNQGTATAWKQMAGDAGWAGVLADFTMTRPDMPVALVFSPGMNMLPLIDEAMALVRPEMRWAIGFSTYLTDLLAGTSCAWRCMLPDAPMLADLKRNKQALILDLTTSGQCVASMGGVPIEGLQAWLSTASEQCAKLVECADNGANPWSISTTTKSAQQKSQAVVASDVAPITATTTVTNVVATSAVVDLQLASITSEGAHNPISPIPMRKSGAWPLVAVVFLLLGIIAGVVYTKINFPQISDNTLKQAVNSSAVQIKPQNVHETNTILKLAPTDDLGNNHNTPNKSSERVPDTSQRKDTAIKDSSTPPNIVAVTGSSAGKEAAKDHSKDKDIFGVGSINDIQQNKSQSVVNVVTHNTTSTQEMEKDKPQAAERKMEAFGISGIDTSGQQTKSPSTVALNNGKNSMLLILSSQEALDEQKQKHHEFTKYIVIDENFMKNIVDEKGDCKYKIEPGIVDGTSSYYCTVNGEKIIEFSLAIKGTGKYSSIQAKPINTGKCNELIKELIKQCNAGKSPLKLVFLNGPEIEIILIDFEDPSLSNRENISKLVNAENEIRTFNACEEKIKDISKIINEYSERIGKYQKEKMNMESELLKIENQLKDEKVSDNEKASIKKTRVGKINDIEEKNKVIKSQTDSKTAEESKRAEQINLRDEARTKYKRLKGLHND